MLPARSGNSELLRRCAGAMEELSGELSKHERTREGLAFASAFVVGAGFASEASAQWAPTKTVEFIVPAGTGGGADQMARMIQGIIQKHDLMDQSMVVINKSGGAGAEGFLDVKASEGDPHKIIITLSNLFTTPLATGVPFSWDELTPVSMLALDNFILWVNADSPYQTAAEYVEAVKAGRRERVQDGRHRVQGGGPDHHRRDRAEHRRQVHLHPLQGRRRRRGAARRQPHQLVGQQPDRGGLALARAARCGRSASSANERIEVEQWDDVPTCKESGLDVEYQMLRGIFMPPGVDQEAVDFYVDLFAKVRETPEWQEFMANGAFNTDLHVGRRVQGLARRDRRRGTRS